MSCDPIKVNTKTSDRDKQTDRNNVQKGVSENLLMKKKKLDRKNKIGQLLKK